MFLDILCAAQWKNRIIELGNISRCESSLLLEKNLLQGSCFNYNCRVHKFVLKVFSFVDASVLSEERELEKTDLDSARSNSIWSVRNFTTSSIIRVNVGKLSQKLFSFRFLFLRPSYIFNDPGYTIIIQFKTPSIAHTEDHKYQRSFRYSI